MLFQLFGKKTPAVMREIHLFNTESGKLELFEPVNDKTVKMYSCGPTVYDYAHIGNLRSYIFADVLKRVLIHNGFLVQHTINFTDFGHLTDDGDAGEDDEQRDQAPAGDEQVLPKCTCARTGNTM